MQRRQFLHRAAVTSAAALAPRMMASQPPEAGGGDFVDTHVWLSQWPTRRTAPDSPAQLVAKLRQHGVTSAWTGSFDGALHTDLAGVNARLAEACAREGGGVLLPFGTVNPALPDWEEDVRRCAEVHRMRGLRVFPNYHGYTLDDPRFARLLDLAAQRGLLVQVSVAIEDSRAQDPVFTVPAVDATSLPETLARVPAARVMLLNGFMRSGAGSPAIVNRLAATGRVWHEIAALEGVAAIEKLLLAAPRARLAFGSHTPWFYFESALLKLQESALTGAQLAALRAGSARDALFPWP